MIKNEMEEKIARWSMHWDAHSFISRALTLAYNEGRQDAWTEMQAMKDAILERNKNVTGSEPVTKEGK